MRISLTVLFLIFTAGNIYSQNLTKAQKGFLFRNINSIELNGNYFVDYPIDTMTIKYFPMAVGNVYKYHFASSSGFNYYFNIRIIKDTIIHSKKYFLVSRVFPGMGANIIRMDTATGNLFESGSSGCSWSPYEYLVDSLRSSAGDSSNGCYHSQKHHCLGTSSRPLFGQTVSTKSFIRYNFEGTDTYIYGLNFGLIQSVYSDLWGMGGESLVGCYINGVLYGDTTLTNVNLLSSSVPEGFELGQNYPNPFNAVTSIKFKVTSEGVRSQKTGVRLKVYDLNGRVIRTLVNEGLNPGTYEVQFDAGDLPSGVYFYQLRAGDFSEVKKMILTK